MRPSASPEYTAGFVSGCVVVAVTLLVLKAARWLSVTDVGAAVSSWFTEPVEVTVTPLDVLMGPVALLISVVVVFALSVLAFKGPEHL